MKERIISAIIALLITVPLFLLGGIYFKVLVVILSLLGLRELMNAKDKIPKYMKYISYILLLLLMISSFELINVDFYLDLKLVILVMILTILPVLIYSDNEVYNVVDAFYLISSILFLYIAFNLFIIVRDENIMLGIYLLIVPMITDIFAYFGGIKFGRYKLTKSFSPNKSVEGVIIGTVFSTILASLFYYFCVNVDTSIILIIVMSLFLSIIGQFGDLFFSSIKRYFKIKDFSNIMPGHGGILDRCDSMIFVLLGYVFIIGIL